MAVRTRRRPAVSQVLPWRPAALVLLGLLLILSVILRLTEHRPPKLDESLHPLQELVELARDAVSLPEGWHREKDPEIPVSEGLLVLVNNQHPYDAETTTELLSVYENKWGYYEVKDWVLSVRPELMDALNRWLKAGYDKNMLMNVNVVAGYRSYETQKELYDNAVATHGADYAAQYISLPGASEHHTGYATDLGIVNFAEGTSEDFTGEGKQAWLAEHAWEYGLILRYPEGKQDLTGIAYESWHYRYVGLPHAQIITERGICLEEYIELLREYPFDGPHLCGNCRGKNYEIYYCPADELILPNSGSYAISGNNVDGYIVTLTGYDAHPNAG